MSAAEAAFIRAHTVLGRAALVPELRLYLATEITPIWQATEDWLAVRNIAPPFWAFAWPGGQVMARHMLDNPALVAGKRVLDFAAGGGIAALAAVLAGAADVEANEIDALAVAAIGLNAAENGLAVRAVLGDIVGCACRWDLILAGDVCYEAPMSGVVTVWLKECARAGATVLMADPGRAYVPKTGLRRVAIYDVPTTLELEDRITRRTTLYEFA